MRRNSGARFARRPFEYLEWAREEAFFGRRER